jgi:hypothetical protein
MKEYMLLRNNKETGPHSLDELKEMGLKPFDLVWHQKKSAAWKYPSEIDELAALLPVMETADMQVNNNKNAVGLVENTWNVESVHQPVGNKSALITEDKEDTPVRYIRHVVALKPTIDQTHVKTIKSTSQPNIVKVEIRDKELTTQNNNLDEPAIYHNDQPYQPHVVRNSIPTYTASVDKQVTVTEYGTGVLSPRIMQPQVADNKLEWMVLIIGATSLIAIVYLLITSPY